VHSYLIDAAAWPICRAALWLACAAGGIRLVMLRKRVRLLENLAVTDPLTGAFNRRHLDAALATAIERRARNGERAALLLLDVDRFKDLNDTLGHAAGDEVLKSLAAMMRARARRVDALFRVGGEEFAVLLAGADLRDAVGVAEELRLMVERASLAAQRVSVSIGVCDLHPAHTPESWMHDADMALYLAKRGGRNRVAARDGHIGPYGGDGTAPARMRIVVPYH
jgi:diguanylate cyclase (GGDEF)-like protein